MEISWANYDGRPFFRKARLSLALSRLDGVRIRREKGRTKLAIPYEEGKEFPLTELFCFAQMRRIDGKCFVVYTFDDRKNPIFCEN